MKSFWAKRLPLSLLVKPFTVAANLNAWYVFGALLLLSLALQLLTGFWLTMFYIPSSETAFASVQFILRQVPYGWLLRDLHAVNASFIFIFLYLHLLRSLWYRSYQKSREVVWLLGVILLFIMWFEAFCGYLLPWGQMSYWAATVATQTLSALPGGELLMTWLRGDYIVSSPTLQRFFALHILAIPLLLIFLIRLHIKALHHVGSGHPGEIYQLNTSQIPFYPKQFHQDMVAFLIYLFIFCATVFFIPQGFGLLQDPINAQIADSMHTPAEIRPLWYLSAFYTILRAIPNKIAGLSIIVLGLISLMLIPWISRYRQKRVNMPVTLRFSVMIIALLCYLGLTALGLLPMTALSSFFSLGFVIIGTFALYLAL